MNMVHTPPGGFVLGFPYALDNVMSEDVGHFDGVVDLHGGVDALAAVAVEIPTGFLTGCDEDTDVV